MTTPKKMDIEISVANAIKAQLEHKKRDKKWLASNLRMDYGKVKRVLSSTSTQQLSLSVADQMLMLLGSNLQETISQSTKRRTRRGRRGRKKSPTDQ